MGVSQFNGVKVFKLSKYLNFVLMGRRLRLPHKTYFDLNLPYVIYFVSNILYSFNLAIFKSSAKESLLCNEETKLYGDATLSVKLFINVSRCQNCFSLLLELTVISHVISICDFGSDFVFRVSCDF